MKFPSTSLKAFLAAMFLFTFATVSGQISAPTASSTTSTAYTNGAPNNSIYMFCVPNQSTTDIGSLTATAPSGTAPFTFNWSLFNSTAYSFDPYTTTTGTTSTINNLPSGGYFVSIVDAGGNPVGCYTAWVFDNRSNIDVANIPAGCGAFTLHGTADPVANFTYYNPPLVDQMLITAATSITVCFSATHTYVSDLGFYLVSPCGQTIPLSPNPGSIGQGAICNSGDNVNNLCFSSTTATDLNVCTAATPLTGTYGHYGVAPGTAINWAPLYGCDAAQGGWKVQIYDCIAADVGALTHATITFTGATRCGMKTITYNSGTINSAINDNSCTAASASNFVVPPVSPSPISLATPNTITSFQWTCNNPCVTIPNATTSLSPTISPAPTSNTWFYLTAVDNMGCNHLVDSALYVSTCPCPITAVTKNILPCNSGPNTFDITGQVTFSNPPCTGQLIVTTCSGAQQVFNAPFTSPISYSLTGIVSDGTPGCTVTANFTNGPAGCVFTTPTFTEPTPVVVTVTNPAAVCAPATVDLTAGAVTAGSTAGGTFSYWTNAAGTTPLASPGAVATSGTYYIRNTVGSCSAIQSVTVTVNPTPVVGVNSVTVCPGQSAVLTATGAAGYSWSTGQLTASITVAPTVTTSYVVTGTTTGCSATATAVVTVGGSISPTVTSDTICNGQAATLTATGGTTYTWDNGMTTNPITVSPTATTSYVVTAHVGSCSGTATATVVVNPLPTTTVPANVVVCNNGTVPATAFTSAPAGGTFNWTNSNPAIGLGASGNGNITAFTATNATANSITATISVTATTNGCAGPPSTYTITVNPTPTVVVPADITVCNNGTVTGTTFTSPTTGATYTWTNSDPTIGLGANGIGNIASFTATNTTASPITATITVTPSANGCTGTASTYNITINPTPTVVVPADVTVCDNGVVTGTTFTSPTTGATYTWTNSDPTIGIGANGIGDIASFTATNTTANPVTATITVTPSANSCTGTASTYNITINPTPTVVVPADITICNNGTIPATTFTSPTTGATYTWTNSNPAIGIGANGIGDIASFTATNSTSASITAVITVTPSANGCTGIASTYNITVDPTPAAPTAAGAAICANTAAILTATAPGGTYDWYSAATAGTLLAGNSATYTTPNISTSTTYYVQTTMNGCVSPRTPVVVSIAAGLSVDAGLNDTVCFGGTANLAVTPNGAGYHYTWSPGATLSNDTLYNPTATPTATTTYSVTVTDPNGCVGSDSVMIFADPQITLAIAGLPTSCFGSCDGQAIVIPSGGSGTYPTYAWSSGCTTPACTRCAGSDTVTVTDSWGCTASNNTTITEPTAITATTTQVNVTCFAACNGTATVTPSGGTPGATGYNYSWNTTPVAQTTQTATGLCAGTYICTITDSHSCSLTQTVTITEPTQVVLTPIANAVICNSGSTTLTTAATGGNGGPYHYVWTPTMGLSSDTISNPVANPLATTTYIVNATDVNGCAAGSQTVTVSVNPALSVTAFGTASVCPGSSTVIYATGVNGNGGPYNFSWSPTTGLSNPTNDTTTATPTVTTTYTVTVTDGCSPVATSTVTVTVLPLPAPIFAADVVSGCVPLCVNFTDASTLSSGTITNWSWDFNDGPLGSGNTVNHCFLTPGVYSIVLTVTSAAGCTSTVTYNNMIAVNPIPVAGFTAPLSTSIVNPTVQFTDNSTGGAQWQWNFGDSLNVAHNTSTQQNPSHTFSDVGTYCVQQTVTSAAGCSATTSICVVIDPEFTFYIPNAFSPNGDGINDEFYGKGDFITDFEMSIYDRWGNLIFYTDDINKHWDGTANHGSTIAQMDTYVYVVNLKDYKDKKHKYIGSVTLVK